MTAKRKLKITTDMLMIIMLPFLMAYQLIGEAVHEWIGTAQFIPKNSQPYSGTMPRCGGRYLIS